ncbi:hypothetical protein ZWY2020_031380, partial [Hordeum vulgare]
APCGVEWNYNYHHDALEGTAAPPPAVVALAACYTARPEPEACSDVWFRYSPPPASPHPRSRRGGSPRATRPGCPSTQPRPRAAAPGGWCGRGAAWMGCLGLNSCVASCTPNPVAPMDGRDAACVFIDSAYLPFLLDIHSSSVQLMRFVLLVKFDDSSKSFSSRKREICLSECMPFLGLW